jgi:predicted N-acyltransferase
MVSGLEARVCKSVDEIGKEAIDRLVNDGFFTYGWLKTLEASKPPIKLDPFYVAVHKNNELVGFAPCFRDIADQYFQYGPIVIPFMRKILTLNDRLHLGQSHVLLCYSPWCFRTKIFAKGEKRDILKNISKVIDQICKEERISFSSFLFVSEFDQGLMVGLEKLGYHPFFWKNTLYLNINWKSFEDYLSSLKESYRRQIRREIKSCSENGITIQIITRFKELSSLFSDLSYEQTTKYNKWAHRLEPLLYESLYDYAHDNTVVFAATRNNKIIGFTLFIRKDSSIDAFIAGFDYSSQKKSDFTYFNLAYYAPIKWAIEQGVEKIYYRWGSEDAKYKRGCRAEKIFSFVKCQNMLINYQINTLFLINSRIKKYFK